MDLDRSRARNTQGNPTERLSLLSRFPSHRGPMLVNAPMLLGSIAGTAAALALSDQAFAQGGGRAGFAKSPVGDGEFGC